MLQYRGQEDTDIPSNNKIDLDNNNNNKRSIPNELSMNHRQQSDKKTMKYMKTKQEKDQKIYTFQEVIEHYELIDNALSFPFKMFKGYRALDNLYFGISYL